MINLRRTLLPNLESTIKGQAGECYVRYAARLLLPDCEQFSNVTLPTKDSTTQIDHIFVSRFGTFVVETKNMDGRIYGRPSEQRWTQWFPRKTATFQNPLLQNRGHVKALQAVLQLPWGSIRSVVAFVGNASLMTRMPASVTTDLGFATYIRSFSRPVLSQHRLERICDAIATKRLTPSPETRRRHIRNVEQRRSGGCRSSGTFRRFGR